MFKRISLAILAATIFILNGCVNVKEPSSSVVPADEASVKKDVVFEDVHKRIDEAVYTMVFEPITTAKTKQALGMDMPEDFDADWLPETENSENFNIMHMADKTNYAFANIYTAPANPSEYYKTEDKDKILEEMQSTYFTVMNVHDGLLMNSTEDFGYKLVTDWTGKSGDWDFYLLEFVDEEKEIYSIRFMTGNDLIDENYYSFSFKADIPLKEKEIINSYRQILFSMREMQLKSDKIIYF